MSIFRSEQIEQPVNFSGSFTGSLVGTASYATFSETSNTSSLVTTSSFNSFTSSYYTDSASFDYRIENIIVDTGSFDNSPVTVNVATTTVLPRSPLYYNGPANNGVDAYLSASVSGTLGNIDGVSLSVGDHFLVKNQSNAIQNGVYNIISTGSASSYYILSRSLSSDETSELDSQIVIPSFGNTNKGGIFAQTTNNPSIGVDNIVYTQQTNTLVTQNAAGTQRIYQIPWYLSGTRQISKGSNYFKYVNVVSGSSTTTSSLVLTGSFNISGSINLDGSLIGTASYATTASYWSGSIETASFAFSSSYATTASYVPLSRSFGITINGGGSEITTGIKNDIIIPYNMIINGYTMVADVSGSIVMDLWKSTYNNYPPTSVNSITDTQKPTINNDIKSINTNLTNWTSSINAGDVIRFNVSSSSTITKLTLIINGYN